MALFFIGVTFILFYSLKKISEDSMQDKFHGFKDVFSSEISSDQKQVCLFRLLAYIGMFRVSESVLSSDKSVLAKLRDPKENYNKFQPNVSVFDIFMFRARSALSNTQLIQSNCSEIYNLLSKEFGFARAAVYGAKSYDYLAVVVTDNYTPDELEDQIRDLITAGIKFNHLSIIAKRGADVSFVTEQFLMAAAFGRFNLRVPFFVRATGLFVDLIEGVDLEVKENQFATMFGYSPTVLILSAAQDKSALNNAKDLYLRTDNASSTNVNWRDSHIGKVEERSAGCVSNVRMKLLLGDLWRIVSRMQESAEQTGVVSTVSL
jgi:hypothetical protein